LLDSYITDEPKPGRPLISLNLVAMVKEIITKNATIRSFLYSHITIKVATKLGVEKSIYAKTIYKVLKAKKYKSYKQTTKPGLIKEIKDARWKWCLEHKD